MRENRERARAANIRRRRHTSSILYRKIGRLCLCGDLSLWFGCIVCLFSVVRFGVIETRYPIAENWGGGEEMCVVGGGSVVCARKLVRIFVCICERFVSRMPYVCDCSYGQNGGIALAIVFNAVSMNERVTYDDQRWMGTLCGERDEKNTLVD